MLDTICNTRIMGMLCLTCNMNTCSAGLFVSVFHLVEAGIAYAIFIIKIRKTIFVYEK